MLSGISAGGLTKRHIVAELEVPGAVISMVARRRGVARSHIFECGERAAAMYSLIVTAKLNSIALSRKLACRYAAPN